MWICITIISITIIIISMMIIIIIRNSIGGVLEAPVPEKSGLVKKMSPFSKPEKPL